MIHKTLSRCLTAPSGCEWAFTVIPRGPQSSPLVRLRVRTVRAIGRGEVPIEVVEEMDLRGAAESARQLAAALEATATAPVRLRKARAGGASTEAVRCAMYGDPERAWSVPELAAATGLPRNKVTWALVAAVRYRTWAERVGRGRYRIVPESLPVRRSAVRRTTTT